VLLICPPPLNVLVPIFADMFAGGYEKSQQLAPYFQKTAQEQGVHYLNGGDIIQSSAVDSIHFDASEHRKLGEAVAAKVRAIFGK
jgi:hypothetical protein